MSSGWSTASLLGFALGAGCAPPSEPDCGPGTVCTIAGTGTNGFDGDGRPATETMFYFPSAVRALDGGRVAVVDFNNMRVRVIEADGTVGTIAGSGVHAYSSPGVPALETALENPVDVEFLDDGSFYIAALHEARILYVDTDGLISAAAGTGDWGFAGDGEDAREAWISEAAGIAVDDGSLYIADTDNNCLRAVGEDGAIHAVAGAMEPGLVDGAADVARFRRPQRLHADGGFLYVADADNHAVRRVDLSTGEVETIAGTGVDGYDGDGGPATSATLRTPYGVVARDGVVWIADSGNHVIRRVDAEGIIETIAGDGVEGYAGDDGPPLLARFAFPVDLALDGDAVLVADFKNGAVRRIR
jgi:DNA-binding beta-propeller fold protein YncE